MPILKRPPGDSFTLRIFLKLVNELSVPVDPIYIWSAVIEPGYHAKYWDSKGRWTEELEIDYRHLLFENIKREHVVFALKDHLTSINNFNPWVEKSPVMVDYLSNLFAFYSDKKFLLCTSLENLESYITNENVSIIPWGGDITNQELAYRTLEPVAHKSIGPQHFVTLNRNARPHRAHLLSLLANLNIQQHGKISCMFDAEQTARHSGWQTSRKELLPDAPITTTIHDEYEIYKNNNNDNVTNFNTRLRGLYETTCVEIVTETSFVETAYLITEKTLNSIYGCNFPIILCGKGAVQLLRDIGFDMFDDVIDHSYDVIDDPADRLYEAITRNTRLLTDRDYAIARWGECKTRFASNVNIARNKMHDYFKTRALAKFEEVKTQFEMPVKHDTK